MHPVGQQISFHPLVIGIKQSMCPFCEVDENMIGHLTKKGYEVFNWRRKSLYGPVLCSWNTSINYKTHTYMHAHFQTQNGY